MSPTRSARRLAGRLVLLALLVAALLVVLVPATAAPPPWSNAQGNGQGVGAVDDHQPYGVGNGRKIK